MAPTNGTMQPMNNMPDKARRKHTSEKSGWKNEGRAREETGEGWLGERRLEEGKGIPL